MLAGVANLALSHSVSYVTPHFGPILPELKFGDHYLDSCVSLFVGVPNQLQAYGRRKDYPLPLRVYAVCG